MQANPAFLVEPRERDFAVSVGDEVAEGGPLTLAVAPAKLARTLGDLAIALRATGGVLTEGLRRHLTEHDGVPLGSCQFCRLQGRVLAAEGRRRLRDEEHNARRMSPVITQLPLGATAAGAARAAWDREERAAQREAARKRALPRLNAAKRSTDGDTDVWF